jgi:hypothetical protein
MSGGVPKLQSAVAIFELMPRSGTTAILTVIEHTTRSTMRFEMEKSKRHRAKNADQRDGFTVITQITADLLP